MKNEGGPLHLHFFSNGEYLEEFREVAARVPFSERNPLNTEMFFLWSMVRAVKPQLFIESGTFRGYSAHFVCEALARNANDAEFVTFGYNLDNCLPFARERLQQYPFATVIEQDSREGIKRWSSEKRLTAFFVDGPKGRNMPPLFFSLTERFENIAFIAVHDCERESGSGNRWYLEQFFEGLYPIMYCDSAFQERFQSLDEPLIGRSELIDWRPHFFFGREQESYGTETGYVLPSLGHAGGPLRRLRRKLYRAVRFGIVQHVAMWWRRSRNRSD